MTRYLLAGLFLLRAIDAVPAAAQDAKSTPASSPGFETIFEGGRELVGVAVGPDRAVYVSDRQAGRVYRLVPGDRSTVAARGLGSPVGLGWTDDGQLLILDEEAGQLLRLEASGALTTLARGLRRPRWLAVGPEGSIYISASTPLVPGGPKDSERSVIVRRDPASGALTMTDAELCCIGGLAADGDALYAAGRQADSITVGVIARYPMLETGDLGPATYFQLSELSRPGGLVLDVLGAFYVSDEQLTLGGERVRDAIAKVHRDTHVTPFAAALEDPRGMALGPDGSLHVADGQRGRVVRFPAPPAAAIDGLPTITAQSPLDLSGAAAPASRVDAFLNGADEPSVSAFSGQAGRFSMMVPLTLDAENTLEIFATDRRGDGLTGAVTERTVIHDGLPPALDFLSPMVNAHVRQTVSVQARASDGGSGVGSLTLTADGQTLVPSLSSSLPAPSLTATVAWNTSLIPDGTHTLAATSRDQAGNSTSVSRTVLVDNTPPDTTITAGPSESASADSGTFAFTGTDNLTPASNLQFSWRLDAGPWTAFTSATETTLAGLAAGPHIFEVMAGDLAGNVDPTPARRAFTVSSLQITITQPLPGTVLPAGLILVQGIVNAPGADTGVSVNGFPVAVYGSAFAGLAPVTPDMTSLTAVATTATGATGSQSVGISATGPGDPQALLRASPSSGTAPLTVAFALAQAPAGSMIELDLEGDGSIEFTGPSLDGQAFIYRQPGLYIPTATVTDSQGTRTVVRNVLQVFDPGALDALLRGKWAALKDALRVGDVGRALTQISTHARPRYDRLLQILGPRLTGIDTILTDITLDEFARTEAFYEMPRTDDGVPLSFEVRFAVDDDGLWRLRSF